jgi:hypothetical protein
MAYLGRLTREPDGMIIADRLQVIKRFLFVICPSHRKVSASLEEWFAFLQIVKEYDFGGGSGVRRINFRFERAKLDYPGCGH